MKKSEAIKRLVVFEVNRMRRMEEKQNKILADLEKRQKQFFENELKKKSLDDYLTVKELTEEFNISLSTFKRYRDQGLNTYQNGCKGKIAIRKGDYIEFLNNKELW